MATSVAHSIPEEFRREFYTNLEHEIQQVHSKFGDRVKIDTFEGKENIYGSLEQRTFKKRTGRLQQSDPTEAEIHNRKMVKVPFYDQAIFDKWDKEFLGKLKLPDSETIQSTKYAYHRLIDEEVCKAASATVYGGEEPYVTAIDMPSTQQVAVDYVESGAAADSGLTPEKLMRTLQIMEENDYDCEEEEIFFAWNPVAKRQLIQAVRDSGNDTWATMMKAFLAGEEKSLFGFTPILTNRLERASSTNVDTCFAWVKRQGIYMEPGGLEVMMDVLPQQQHALQISAYATLGFMRRQEKAVVQVFTDSDL